jgi:2-polyprenyl-6-hydroxyphenyl methylase/3-demethylubiquinone-9 3-methyltransferase
MANDLTLYDTPDWWSEQGPLYLLRKLNPGRFGFFDRTMPTWKDVSVLDAGCGGGFTSEFLAARGAKVTGLDASAAAIDVARRHSAHAGLAINYTTGSITELPFADSSFDAVVCVDVLEHVPGWRQALAEFHRVLRPGGQLFFDTINRNPMSAFFFVPVLERTLGLIARGTHDPRLFIRPQEISETLQKLGFIKTNMTGFHVMWSPWKRDYSAFAGGPKTLMYIGSALKRD